MEKSFKPLNELSKRKKRKKSINDDDDDDVSGAHFNDLESITSGGVRLTGVNAIPAPLMSNSSRSDSNSSSVSSSSSSSSTSSTKSEKLLCLDCNSCLCPNCLKRIMELEERENSCNALYCVSAFRCALIRCGYASL